MMMPGQRILLETALTNQDKIGWNYALRGYLSTSWVDSEHIVDKQPHDGIRSTDMVTHNHKEYMEVWEDNVDPPKFRSSATPRLLHKKI
jgi:hypothetical protein